jgi:hypothetical protein
VKGIEVVAVRVSFMAVYPGDSWLWGTDGQPDLDNSLRGLCLVLAFSHSDFIHNQALST